MKQVCAVLINVTGIQSFIFHSNKLRENIGASYIIEHLIYQVTMKEVLQSIFKKEIGIDDWKNNFEVKIHNPDVECEVGYIGGGNALLLFNDVGKAKKFIKAFSTQVLLNYPALQLVFGKKEDFDLDNYQDEYKALMKNLKANKAAYTPVTSIFKHGITDDCPWSNDSAEEWYEKDKVYISKASKVKTEATEIAQEPEKQMYESLQDHNYEFTQDVKYLGQENEKSYIAVVHIDGNGMGKIFESINDLKILREMSVMVSSKAETSMNLLLKDLIAKAEIVDVLKGKKAGTIDELTFRDFKYLPIRPILVGGDDITFLCEGRLGMYLAEKFIAFFYDKEEQDKAEKVAEAMKTKGEMNEEERKTAEIEEKLAHKVIMDGACAGVAIVKTHFPFYKAVYLAEELCAEAKTKSRNDKGCYISYYYSATTFSGALSDLRKRVHRTSKGNHLYYGPYRLFKPNEKDSIENLKKGIKHFKNIETDKEKPKWANNKVMRLRDVMADNEEVQALFMKEMTDWNLSFSDEKREIWEQQDTNTVTPYFDQIELMDFYLPSLLEPIEAHKKDESN